MRETPWGLRQISPLARNSRVNPGVISRSLKAIAILSADRLGAVGAGARDETGATSPPAPLRRGEGSNPPLAGISSLRAGRGGACSTGWE